MHFNSCFLWTSFEQNLKHGILLFLELSYIHPRCLETLTQKRNLKGYMYTIHTYTHTYICTFVIFLTAVFQENENFASLGDWSLQYYFLRKILFYWQKYPKTSSSPIRTLLDIKMMRIILLTHDIDPVITKVSKSLSISMSFIED